MPVAICNTCNELVPHRGIIKNAVCKCGSSDVTAVSGHLNVMGTGWVYKDRKGDFKKYVPRDTEQLIESND